VLAPAPLPVNMMDKIDNLLAALIIGRADYWPR
jgi:hypothetical protein